MRVVDEVEKGEVKMEEQKWTTEAGLIAIANHYGTHRCGYVGVPLGHPLHCVGYSERADCLSAVDVKNAPLGKRGIITLFSVALSDCVTSPMAAFDVHGGITFAGKLKQFAGDDWFFGFDCNHADDSLEACTLSYVVSECEMLASQIVALVPLRANMEAAK